PRRPAQGGRAPDDTDRGQQADPGQGQADGVAEREHGHHPPGRDGRHGRHVGRDDQQPAGYQRDGGDPAAVAREQHPGGVRGQAVTDQPRREQREGDRELAGVGGPGHEQPGRGDRGPREQRRAQPGDQHHRPGGGGGGLVETGPVTGGQDRERTGRDG